MGNTVGIIVQFWESEALFSALRGPSIQKFYYQKRWKYGRVQQSYVNLHVVTESADKTLPESPCALSLDNCGFGNGALRGVRSLGFWQRCVGGCIVVEYGDP